MEFRDLKIQYDVLKSKINQGIADVISSAHFISGPQVKQLEKELAAFVGVRHCVTCANGTDAITLAMMVWGIGKGDAVFVPDFTFFSSGECPAFSGATPIFVDVKQETYNIDPDKLEIEIKRVQKEGKYTPKAVISVDLFGLPADYPQIQEITRKNGLLLFEDGAQGFGGEINGKKACSFGDISSTSFFPAKPLGCYGDGGAIFTNKDEWAKKIRSFCVHGKDLTNPDDPNSKYNNKCLGMNSRLDTLQAAILLPKLEAFKDYELSAVNQVALWYSKTLESTRFVLPVIREGFYSSWAQFTIQLPDGICRDELQVFLKESGIPSMIYYPKPMHLQEAFAGTDSAKATCPITLKLCRIVLSLPLHPYMKKDDVEFVGTKLKEFLTIRESRKNRNEIQ